MKSLTLTVKRENDTDNIYIEVDGFNAAEVIGLLEMAKIGYERREREKEPKNVTLCRPCIYYDGCFNNNKDNERCVMFKEEETE